MVKPHPTCVSAANPQGTAKACEVRRTITLYHRSAKELKEQATNDFPPGFIYSLFTCESSIKFNSICISICLFFSGIILLNICSISK